MAETLVVTENATRAQRYAELTPQIDALVLGESDMTANLANIAAALKETFGFFWVGFYIEKGGELVLGPFQGPVACTRIAPDKGVCGHSYTTRKAVIVADVDAFPGHIACSSAARSEIVIPIFNGDRVFGVLDVDSDQVDDFSQDDLDGLSGITRVIERVIQSHTNSVRRE